MRLRTFIILLILGTIIGWVGWLVVLYELNPDTAGTLGLTLFYLALFFALVGTFTLLGIGIRALFAKGVPIYRQASVAMRQSSLFAILVVGSLMLMGNNLYTWWSVLLLLVGLTALELFFSSHRINHDGDV